MRKFLRCCRGSLSPWVLLVLMAMGFGAASHSVLSRGVLGQVSRLQKRVSERNEIFHQVDGFVEALMEASRGDADSPRDLESIPGFVRRRGSRFLYEYSNGVSLSAEEISSRLNPNFDPVDYWRSTLLVSRCSSCTALALWEAERIKGFFADRREDFDWIVYSEDWERFYTLYSPIIPGGCEPEVLGAYLRINRWTEAAIDEFRHSQGERSLGEGLTPAWLTETVSPRGRAPALQIQPGWNVNIMDEELLSALIDYPWGGEGLQSPPAFKAGLLRARLEGEVTSEVLGGLLVDESGGGKDAFLTRFGVRSWYWRITARRGSRSFEFILRRVPGFNEEDSIRGQGGGPSRVIQVVVQREN